VHGGPLRLLTVLLGAPTYDRCMWGSGRRAGASLVVLAALVAGTTGCGDRATPSPAPRPTSASASDLPTSAASTDGNGDMVPPLPDLTSTPKPTFATPTLTPGGRVFGADMSWPQCPKGMGIRKKRTEGRPLPTAAARFIVLGLTNGPSFVANPCLEDQVAWVKERHLRAAAYSVVSYPDKRTLSQLRDRGPFPGGTRRGALSNVGYQAALYNVDTMRRAGLQTPVVWIDVEPITGFDWSPDVRANAAVVQGMERGYRDAGFRIGYYSIGSLWARVVGSLRTGAPEWRPAGDRGLGEALNRCRPDWSFGGGPAVLGQWIEDHRDRNVVCPGAVHKLEDWFHQY